MSIGSIVDSIFEDLQCPRCFHVGMDSDGDMDWICPNCGYEGSLEEPDYDDDDT